MPLPKTSFKYQFYKQLCGEYKARAYKTIGVIVASMNLGDQVSVKILIKHFERARIIYNILDMKTDAKQMDLRNSIFRAL